MAAHSCWAKCEEREESMSSYPFRILNTYNVSALSLLNWSVRRPKVVSLMWYGPFRRSLDSSVALHWIPSISFMSQSLNGDHILDAYGILHMWTDESIVAMYKYNSRSISLSMYWKLRWIRQSMEFGFLILSAKCLVNWRSSWKLIPRSALFCLAADMWPPALLCNDYHVRNPQHPDYYWIQDVREDPQCSSYSRVELWLEINPTTGENSIQIVFGNHNLFFLKHILMEYNKLKCFNDSPLSDSVGLPLHKIPSPLIHIRYLLLHSPTMSFLVFQPVFCLQLIICPCHLSLPLLRLITVNSKQFFVNFVFLSFKVVNNVKSG